MPTLRIDQEYDSAARLIEQRRYSDAAGTQLVGNWRKKNRLRLVELQPVRGFFL
jgi:hypothetical protein